ncbi:MAG: ParB N-terminal domain-containing protein [Alphaproteobacteria bacterium]
MAKAKPTKAAKHVAKAAPSEVVKAKAKPVAMPAEDDLKAADEGYQLARKDAAKYLHSRRQAMFALSRRYHLEPEDVEQEGFEVLLTCLRDFKPQYTKANGETIHVLFNTFFGSRLDGKALELRNRDPEYQARQAHLEDMSEADKTAFRQAPPLLVQHLDQQTSMQEHLTSEASNARRSNQVSTAMKIAHDSFIDKKLNQLIAQERDDKRRAALMHVKVGGVSSFDDIAYHFGVTDSRASQILNDLMDAFYVQRLLDGDLKSVAYDWKKLKMQPKRAARLLEDAVANSTRERASEIVAAFVADYPEAKSLPLPELTSEASASAPAKLTTAGTGRTFADPFTVDDDARYPLLGLEWRSVASLNPLHVPFRNGADDAHEQPHITTIMATEADQWPLIITHEGGVVDGQRRWHAAQQRGKDKVLCLVRQVPEHDAKIMRVVANLRQIKADKMDVYFAISALSDLGLSQQRIAAALGISRPNVIVYAKVKDKATPKLRALFEDGFIQITNASASVDLPATAQDGMAEFIRKHGATWGKGPQFNEVYEAAASGKLSKLAAMQPEPQAPNTTAAPTPAWAPVPVSTAMAVAPADQNVVQALRNRQTAMETALRDAETWGQQREGVVARQTSEITDLKQQLDALKRELQAHDLLKYGDEATVAGLMKEIKGFYAVVERLAGASYQLDKAHKSLRGQPLSYKQIQEVQTLTDTMEASLSALRVELSSKNRR